MVSLTSRSCFDHDYLYELRQMLRKLPCYFWKWASVGHSLGLSWGTPSTWHTQNGTLLVLVSAWWMASLIHLRKALDYLTISLMIPALLASHLSSNRECLNSLAVCILKWSSLWESFLVQPRFHSRHLSWHWRRPGLLMAIAIWYFVSTFYNFYC